MAINPIICFLSLYIMLAQSSTAQTKYSKFVVDKEMQDTFSFAKQWSYGWQVAKDGKTGAFIRDDGRPITSADTCHLFYTAWCTTNVQRGYDIRYCYADLKKGGLTLTLSDGMPAYASQFYIYIKGDSFYFKPMTHYPVQEIGEKTFRTITKQKLILNKHAYKTGGILMGYVDAEFAETVYAPKQGTATYKYYVKGYIRVPVDGKIPTNR